MEIVWDEPKRQANLSKHAMDFADLDLDFFEGALIGLAKNQRMLAIGRIDGIVTVIFALLGTQALSVVSMRPASAKERTEYEQAL